MADALGQIAFGGGVTAADHKHFEDAAAKLAQRIERQHVGAFSGELSIKEREGTDQKTTLELWGDSLPRVVATSHAENIRDAFHDVCDSALRQVSTHLDKLQNKR